MNRLQQIKEKIHTINPAITDELLDLLCEYVKVVNMPKGGGTLPSNVPYQSYYPNYYTPNTSTIPSHPICPIIRYTYGGGI